MKRYFSPGRWNRYGRAVPDNQVSELDAALPPTVDALLRGHQPVYQQPRHRRSLGRPALAVALCAVGAYLALAPITTGTAVATLLVGPR